MMREIKRELILMRLMMVSLKKGETTYYMFRTKNPIQKTRTVIEDRVSHFFKFENNSFLGIISKIYFFNVTTAKLFLLILWKTVQ